MSFVGRADELCTLGTTVREQRLVVIAGPPGVGKTRLVRRWRDTGEVRAGPWGPTTFYCCLADAMTLDELCASVAQVVGATVGSGSEPDELVGTILSARGAALLILDGVDTRIPMVSGAVARWIDAAPETHVVVTSRTRLGLPGEVVLALPPLSPQDAARLYVTRAYEIGGPDALDGVEDDDVTAVVTRLGGIPLAIDLAASMAREVAARTLADRLDARRAEGCADPLTRVIDESCATLRPGQRSALAQCAVFRGGFDIRAAEAVLDMSGEAAPLRVVDLVQELRDRSLVQALLAGPGTRVRLSLHTAIRAWAEVKLDEAGARAASEARHAAHYLDRARRAARKLEEHSDDGGAQDLLSDERENLLAVHRRGLRRASDRAEWALEAAALLDPLLHAHGPWALREALLESALAASPPERTERLLRSDALYCRGLANVYRGRAPEALDDLETSARLAREGGDAFREGRARSAAGMTLAQRLLRPSEAIPVLERAILQLTRAGSPSQEGVARARLGWARHLQGRTSEAVAAMDRAIGIFQRVGDRRREALVLVDRAIMAHDQGRLEEARLSYEQALAIQRGIGELVDQVRVVGFLGLLAAEQGRHAAAEILSDQAVSLARRLGHQWSEATWIGYRGLSREVAGDPLVARRAYDVALEKHRAARNERQIGLVLALRGGLDASEDRIDVADAALTDAAQCLERLGEPVLARLPLLCRARLELARARAAERLGDRQAAQELRLRAKQCVTDATQHGELSQSIEMRMVAVLCARDPKCHEPTIVHALEVARSGRWFRPPGGEVVRLQRTRAPRLVLARLAQLRVEAPGTAATLSDVLRAGWPDEERDPAARAQRVYGALWALRRNGLGPFLTSRDDGILLDPSIPVTIAPD